MRKYSYIILIIGIIGFSSCEFLEPAKENISSEDFLITKPEYVEGLLLRAYINLPNDYTFNTDVATDDAVANLKGSSYTRMATGEWSPSYYPMSEWKNAYEQIFYVNKFLDIYKTVTWASDPRYSAADNARRHNLHIRRLTGEAYGLRAWYKLQLLQYHGGEATDGRLLGFPIINTNINITDNWELERNTYAECVSSIMTDLDTAIANLPAVFENGSDDIVNETSGSRFVNRINGNSARALKSRLAVIAASPAFAASNSVTWAQAATLSGSLLSDLGTLSSTGKTFYLNPQHVENIWNQAMRNIRSWEQDNFVPSLFGSGRTNPSQNLVDIFPMRNGYPIGHALSGYDPDNPYANRDVRLGDYVLFNGSDFKGATIDTYIGAPSNGINVLETSTRTGYYLKKFMDPGVSLTPASPVNRQHSYTLIRTTEVLLNYAEAANEAWGPDGDPTGLGFTARSMIAALRARGGVTQPDAYLASITSTGDMRELIRRERRIELCFEGFRFWDIRRWGLTTLMADPVEGAFITLEGADLTYEYMVVEVRRYTPHMIYPPIPYEETLKYHILQNKGW